MNFEKIGIVSDCAERQLKIFGFKPADTGIDDPGDFLDFSFFVYNLLLISTTGNNPY
jgi:hypothetical protein